jgi:hypothetical protein
MKRTRNRHERQKRKKQYEKEGRGGKRMGHQGQQQWVRLYQQHRSCLPPPRRQTQLVGAPVGKEEEAPVHPLVSQERRARPSSVHRKRCRGERHPSGWLERRCR